MWSLSASFLHTRRLRAASCQNADPVRPAGENPPHPEGAVSPKQRLARRFHQSTVEIQRSIKPIQWSSYGRDAPSSEFVRSPGETERCASEIQRLACGIHRLVCGIQRPKCKIQRPAPENQRKTGEIRTPASKTQRPPGKVQGPACEIQRRAGEIREPMRDFEASSGCRSAKPRLMLPLNPRPSGRSAPA